MNSVAKILRMFFRFATDAGGRVGALSVRSKHRAYMPTSRYHRASAGTTSDAYSPRWIRMIQPTFVTGYPAADDDLWPARQ